MFITSREKTIIELIIKTSGKHTASSIAAYLNVSVRTIQRDLKSVEKILKSFELQLARNSNKGLIIDGKNEQVFRLIQHLLDVETIDQPPQEKKLQLLLALLQEEAFKIQALSVYLGVSISTLTTYLDELTEWLSRFNIRIIRKRGVGIDLLGSESDKRKALAGYYLLNFHEELIESIFLLENEKCSEELILYYLKPNYLLAIDRLINATFNSFQPRLADFDYIRLIVHIGITMQRTEEDFQLDEDGDFTSELSHEYNLIRKISDELENAFSVEFTKEDLVYLSVILKGSKLQAADEVPYDSVLLSQKIKNLIQNVSSQLHVDLTIDFSLYQGLLAHLEPSLFRLKQQMGLFNPLKEEIKRKYPVLFMAVKNSVEKEFIEIDEFPDDEIAFIVLHFGSALVMREEEILIKALIVCPTGIGTSKMLASRIKKEIIEINSIEISSIKDIQQHGNLKSYDVIISTVRLPFLDIDYLLVSPLLNEENILTIRGFLRNNIENLTKKKHFIKIPQKETLSINLTKVGVSSILQELEDVRKSIQAVLTNFRVYKMPHQRGHEQIIEKMVKMAEKEKLLTHVKNVLESLKDRERKGGLGIPDTEMALFHCRHENVHELIFQVTHLDEPIQIKGMDGKIMYMKNLFLMLAPVELRVRVQEIVSLISTSLIESPESIMIFSSANEQHILQKLEENFLDYLYTNIIKE
ncbi:BglG family transcription antiterminator [Neobacillus ginsengisoli]|uniref:Mannitol operon transcriptional antiterminator n=1 Tax=Neobacillus ginsengisoli TaxID=904295 RepID=A0ABT9Y4C0_9BACI|nr:BglG family transcription antiterminator [Neobacillus ginsengisoli]MDQ0202017.1 mannitol operon transcriptional antiterminator [Neobacillus ginsengisoli]